MKKKNYVIWFIGGLVCNFLVLFLTSIVLKLIFFVFAYICYGISVYELLKAVKNKNTVYIII